MPGYITIVLQKYQHEISKLPQHAPYPSAPEKYGTPAQEPIELDDPKPTLPKGINHVQKYSAESSNMQDLLIQQFYGTINIGKRRI